METRKAKWLAYTVLVGLIPIICRLLIYFFSKQTDIAALSASDFVAFGLVLHISNINEIEYYNEASWKTIYNGLSVAFISVYGVLFATHLLGTAQPGLIDIDSITKVSMLLSGVSFLLSFSIYYRISRLPFER